MRIQQGYAGHFICSSRCLFRLNTCIDGKYIISTVGDMRNGRGEGKREEIAPGAYFETYVFNAKKCDCGCGEYVMSDPHEIDGIRCDTPAEAKSNHEIMCKKYESKIGEQND